MLRLDTLQLSEYNPWILPANMFNSINDILYVCPVIWNHYLHLISITQSIKPFCNIKPFNSQGIDQYTCIIVLADITSQAHTIALIKMIDQQLFSTSISLPNDKYMFNSGWLVANSRVLKLKKDYL